MIKIPLPHIIDQNKKDRERSRPRPRLYIQDIPTLERKNQDKEERDGSVVIDIYKEEEEDSDVVIISIF